MHRALGMSVRWAHSDAAPSRLIRAATHPSHYAYVEQLTSYLKDTFLLHQPGRFVIVNKPYGVSCVGFKQANGGVFDSGRHEKEDESGEEKTRRSAARQSRDVTIGDCIPHLARLFHEPALQFCTGLKRYVSGAIVLPASDRDSENVKRSLQLATGRGGQREQPEEGTHSVLALVVGRPQHSHGVVEGYSTFEQVGQRKEYVFVSGRAPRRARSGQFAVAGTMHWTLVHSAHGVSLVHFSVDKFARHLPRLMWTSLGCPLLGDQLYMRRVADVDGRPVIISPHQAAKGHVKLWLPAALPVQLGMSAADVRQKLPMYCHVYQTVLPSFGWRGKGGDSRKDECPSLVAAAPPPPHWMAMTEALGLSPALRRFMQQREKDAERGYVAGDKTF